MLEEELHIIQPQPGPQTTFINAPTNISIIFFGGSVFGGKSFALLMDSLKYIDCPNYNAIYFRQTTMQLEETLWPEAINMYLPFLLHGPGPLKGKWKDKAKIRQKDHKIIFPSGATTRFSYMELEKDKLQHQGAQYTGIYWDEFTHFTPGQFNYLRTRLRSASKYPSFMRASMNPDPNHFVLEWVDPFLDEDGYPIPELSGKIRYFCFFDGNLFTSWDEEELQNNFPNQKLRTYTFIPSKLTDNKIGVALNPDYESEMDAQTKAEKSALLDGCWKYVLNEGSYFNRDWLTVVDKVPANAKHARAWDKASSVPTDINKYPDYTASTHMAKDKDGYYYLMGDHHPECTDADTGIFGKFRRLPGERDLLIQKQAELDGPECSIVFSRDPGQAGDTEFLESAKKLIEKGLVVRADPMPGNKSKLTRFEPFSAACMNGLVRIVRSSFKNQASLEAFLKEVEQFVGQEATARVKIDWADSSASCFNFLAREQVVDIKGLAGAMSASVQAPVQNQFTNISGFLHHRE